MKTLNDLNQQNICNGFEYIKIPNFFDSIENCKLNHSSICNKYMINREILYHRPLNLTKIEELIFLFQIFYNIYCAQNIFKFTHYSLTLDYIKLRKSKIDTYNSYTFDNKTYYVKNNKFEPVITPSNNMRIEYKNTIFTSNNHEYNYFIDIVFLINSIIEKSEFDKSNLKWLIKIITGKNKIEKINNLYHSYSFNLKKILHQLILKIKLLNPLMVFCNLEFMKNNKKEENRNIEIHNFFQFNKLPKNIKSNNNFTSNIFVKYLNNYYEIKWINDNFEYSTIENNDFKSIIHLNAFIKNKNNKDILSSIDNENIGNITIYKNKILFEENFNSYKIGIYLIKNKLKIKSKIISELYNNIIEQSYYINNKKISKYMIKNYSDENPHIVLMEKDQEIIILFFDSVKINKLKNIVDTYEVDNAILIFNIQDYIKINYLNMNFKKGVKNLNHLKLFMK